MTVSTPPTARSTRPHSALPPTAASSGGCPTSSNSAKTRTPCWLCRWRTMTRLRGSRPRPPLCRKTWSARRRPSPTSIVPRRDYSSPSTSVARWICRSSRNSTASRARTLSPSWAISFFQTRRPKAGRPLMLTSPAMSAPSWPPPSRPARLMPETSRPYGASSPRMCYPATSTPISARRGYRRATSRHSPLICSMSSRPGFPSPT
jgi:hypothetical protein